jgi:hypothetical protein
VFIYLGYRRCEDVIAYSVNAPEYLSFLGSFNHFSLVIIALLVSDFCSQSFFVLVILYINLVFQLSKNPLLF